MNLLRLSAPLLLAATMSPALAADITPTPVEPVAPVQDWRFQATLYGWAAGVSGDVGVRGLPPQDIDVTAWDALQHLKGAVMGSFGAEYGDWLFLTDLMWVKIGDDAQVGRNGGSLDFVQKQLTASALVGYRLPLDIQNLDLSATAGFRYQRLNVSLDLDAADPRFSFDVEGTKQWIDPTIGLSLHYDINERWFINALADVGGFSVGSNFTSQGFATIGYNWTKTISTAIGYRVIYTDYEKDGFVFDTTEQGVFTSVGFHF
ncbi:hypothetical protein K32_03360 [Kaistia sp. 32K]|uniref:hypothetical protein n=1 Tax=Kaistia sp. 32K TaxID=2795690 RepID=UPI00193774F4|nr:hypothetical protein [Kaistia sp. 32K]BCP51719.1 hypothetical protein K32_03360 [Kaistia sp. 32K]